MSKKNLSKKLPKKNLKRTFNNNNNKIVERKIENNLNCKFVTSFISSNKCPKDFPIYTGASVSGLGSTLLVTDLILKENVQLHLL